MAKFCSSTTRC